MDYIEYKEALKEGIEEQLKDVKVQYAEVINNNDTKKEVMTLETKGEPVMIRIPMEDLCKEYVHTRNLEKSKRQVIILYRNRKQVPEEWLDYNWERIRNRVRIRLVRLERNEEYLKNRPYKKVLDMAMIFVVVLQEGGGRKCCCSYNLAAYEYMEY